MIPELPRKVFDIFAVDMDIIPSGEIEKDGALFFLAKMNDAENGTNLQLQNIRKDIAVRTFIIMASVTNAGKVLDAVIQFIINDNLPESGKVI